MDFKNFKRTPGAAARGPWRKVIAIALGVVVLIMGIVAWYWSREPDIFWVDWKTEGRPAVTGYATAHTLIRVSGTLLEKPGGYLSNDITPPSVFLDNIPNWEFGVLIQVRDLSRVLRNDFSRSQTQSIEDPDLAEAEPNFNFDNNIWILPASESRYREAIRHLEAYLERLQSPGRSDAQFYARADNLREWLAVVEKRLGNLSQRLSASVGSVLLRSVDPSPST